MSCCFKQSEYLKMSKFSKNSPFTFSLALTFFFCVTSFYFFPSKSTGENKNVTTQEKQIKPTKQIASKLEKDKIVNSIPGFLDKYFYQIILILFICAVVIYFLGYKPIYGVGNDQLQPGEERRFLGIWSRKVPLLEQNSDQQISPNDKDNDSKSLFLIPPEKPEFFEEVEQEKPSENLLVQAHLDQNDHTIQEINTKANNHFDKGEFLEGFYLLEKNDFIPEELAWRALVYGVDKGHSEGMDKLCMLAQKNLENDRVHTWYSYALSSVDEEDIRTSIEKIDDILVKVFTISIQVIYISAKSYLIRKKESLNESIRFLIRELGKIDETKSKAVLLRALANRYFEKSGDQCWQGMAFLEAARKNDPTATDILFNLAYKYSQLDNNSLALFHYNRLISLDSNYKNALNNAGASSNALNLFFTAVEFYERSWKESKETYSAANLAYLYMQKGFYKDAEDLIIKAREVDNYEERIDQAAVDLRQKKKNETKNKEAFISKGQEYSKLIEKTSKGFLQKNIDIDSLVGEYEGDSIKLKILNSVSGEIHWISQYEKLFGAGNKPKSLKLTIEGLAIIISWGNEDSSKERTSILIGTVNAGNGLLIFNKEDETLEGFYIKSLEKNKLIKLKLKKKS